MQIKNRIKDFQRQLQRRDQQEKDSPIHGNRAQRRAEKARQRLRLKRST